MRYFKVEEDRSAGYTGNVDGMHKWRLPGILGCPTCKATWSDNSKAYPSVDLTPIASLADFEEARPSSAPLLQPSPSTPPLSCLYARRGAGR